MHITVKNLLNINEKVKVKFNSNKNLLKQPEIIAVSKTFKMDHIMPVLNHGHVNFGENKVQEALEKWTLVKNENKKIKLQLFSKSIFTANSLGCHMNTASDNLHFSSSSVYIFPSAVLGNAWHQI